MGDVEYYLAGDPAKSHDFFGIVILERKGKIVRLMGTKELKMDYHIVANYIAAKHRKHEFRKIFMDETGVGAAFVDMLKGRHLPVEGFKLTNPKKIEIVETVIRLGDEGRLKIPRHGAEEIKRQLQEQERDRTLTGMVRLLHPQNSFDDLFWAFCIGVYGIHRLMKTSGAVIFVSKKYPGDRYPGRVAMMSDKELFPELDKDDFEIIDVAKHIPS